MKEPRRVAQCEECGETREMATKTACFTCYKRRKRAEERAHELPHDPHRMPPKQRQQWTKVWTGYTQILNLLKTKLEIPEREIQQIKDILQPFLAPIAADLPLRPKPRPVDVDSDVEVSTSTD